MATFKKDFTLSSGIGLSAEKIYLTSATNSTTISTGALIIPGGAGIAKSLSIGGSLQIFNGNNFTAFKASSSSNDIYTLPSSYPATGTSVLQSTTSGVLSWVPMVAGGGAGTTGSGTVDYGLQNRLAIYPSAGTLVTNSGVSFDINKNQLSFGGINFVGTGNSAISISNVSNGGQILTTWDTLNSGLSLDATNASLRIVGDTNAGTTLVDLGVYDNSGFPTGNWNSKYLFPKASSAIFVNGLQITNSTISNSTSTGSLVVTGGVGIGGSLFITSSLPSSLSGVVVNNSVITTGSWAGSSITAFYGGTGYNSYTKGDILVGAGSTFIKLSVGTNNYVLTASSSSPTGLAWSPTAATGITNLNSLTDTQQYFSVGTSGTGFNISSSGSTHTFNIPIAGAGSTGLITTLSQTIAGQKTFTSTIVGDLSGTASTATYSHQSGYAITSSSASIATTSYNLNVNAGANNIYNPVLFTPQGTGSGVAVSSVTSFSFNPTANILNLSGLAVTAATSSSSSSTGALIVTGGVGIGNSLSLSGRLQIFNGANYTAFVSSATGNTLYTLPPSTPATGSSVLQSDSSGVLSWVPLVASSSGNTAQNIYVNAAGAADVFHPVLFTPAQITSGSAVSSDSLLSYNASSDRLFASGIFVTSGTASTSTFTGGLLVAGGLGVSGQISFTRASLGFTGVTGTPTFAFIGATTSSYISLNVLSDNSLSFEGSSGQLFSIDNNLSTGEIFSVNDISGLPIISASAGQTVILNEFGGVTKIGDGTVNATSTTNAALVVAGGLGITGNAFIGGTATISSSTISSSTSTGALVVSGGVGIGGSLYTSSSNANSISGVVLSNSVVRTGTWSATAITSFYGGTGHSTYTAGDLLVGSGGTLAKLAAGISNYVLTSNGPGTVPSWQAVPPSAASSVAVTTSALDQSFFVTFVNVSSGSGLGLTTTTSFVVNPSSGLVTASGLALTSLANSTSTTTGTLRVSGGLGLTGNAFIGGTVNAPSVNQSNISNVYFTNGNITGTSVTATTIQGTLVGTATTSTNVHLASTGNATGPFYLSMSASSSGSGVALSSDTSLQYNSASDVLTVPYISGTAITASTSFSGQLFGNVTGIATTATNVNVAATGNVTGPFYIIMSPRNTGSGVALSSDSSIQYNTATDVLTVPYISGTAITASTSFSGQLFGNVTGTATTATYANESGYGITSGTATTARNINVSNATTNSPHTIYFGPSATGSGVALSSNLTISFNPSSFILSTSGLAVTAATVSTSSSNGALVVSGGVGIGGSLYVASAAGISGVSINNGVVIGNLTGTATTSTNVHLAVGANASNHSIIFSPASSGAGVALSTDSTLVYNPNTDTLSSTNFSGTLIGTATTGTNVHLSSTGNAAGPFYLTMSGNTSGSGIALSTDSSLSYNSATDVLTVSNISGSAITASTSFSGQLFGNVTGTATTSRNSSVNAATTSLDHYLIFSPNASGSGVALSSGANLVFNPSQNILSVGNGSFAANGVTIGAASNTITTSSGNLNLDSVSGQTNINDNVVIQGNLTVQGTTLTVDSTVSTFVDPVVVLGSGVGGTHSTLDNNQDRGIEFRWSNSGTATTGFFGFNDNDGKFRFIPNASITSANVYSGTAGTAVFATVETTLSGNSSGTASTYTNFYGSLVGTATTSTNVHLAVGANASNHSVIFSPSSTGSGVALSTDSSLLYNPNTDTLTSTNFSGNLTGAVTGTLTGTATTSTNTHLASTGNATGPFYLVMSSGTSGAGLALSSDSSLLYNPNTDTLSSTNFIGSLAGNVTGTATTSTNIHLASTGGATGPFYLTMSIGSSGAGLALSSDSSLSYNSSTDVLTVPNISGAAITASTSFSGQLFGNVTGTASTATYSHQSGYGITAGIATTATNVHLAVGANNVNHSVVFSLAASGAGVGLSTDSSLLYNPNTDTLTSTNFSGNVTGTLTGFASTARSLDVSNAITNSPHTVYFGPTATGSGVALSSNRTISFNPSSFILSTSGLAVTATTVSTNSTSGALIVSGGVGIGGTLNIDGNVKINFTNHTAFNVADVFTIYPVNNYEGANIKSNYSYAFNVQDKSNNNRFTVDVGNNKTILSGNTFSHELRIYNANQVGYTGFVAASSGTVTYTLPAGDGSANQFLKTNGSGVLSWGTAAGNAVTNINGLDASYQYLAFDYSGSFPNWSSSGATHTFNIPLASTGTTGLVTNLAQSFAGIKTFTNDVFISSSTASTWAANGALRVQGGLGVSGQLSFNQAALGYTGAANPSIAFIGGTTGSPITMSVLSDNSLIFEGTSGKLFGINNNLSSGWIFNVGDISGIPLMRANADGNVVMAEFAGNVGVGLSNPAYKLHVTGSVGFTAATASTNVSTGALIVTGGVGIGQSISVGGRLQLFNGANHTAFVSSASGNTVYTLPASSPATGSSVLQSTSTGVMSWVPMTSGASSGTVNSGTATYAAFYASTSTAVSENANIQFTGLGVSVGSNIESISTRSGALYVYGGFGATGNAFIGGTTTIQSSAISISSSTGALVVSGGVGIGGSLYAATSVAANSGANGLSLQKAVGASLGALYSTNVTPSITNYSLATDGTNLNLNSTSNLYLNISNTVKATLTTNNFAVNINVASTASNTGAFTVSGGVGIGGSLYVANLSRFESSTAAISSGTGALTITGGVGIGGSLYAASPSRFESSTASISSGTGALTVTGGAGIGGSLYVASASRFESSVASISTTSGAIVVSGGVGIGGSLYTGGPSRFSDTTQSTSVNTGALVVTGGVGIGQSVSIGGRLILFDGSNHTAFVSSATGNTVYTLPPTSPATGTSILQSTSTGVMSWVSSAGLGASPGGTVDGSVQYKVGSAFGATNSMLYNPLDYSLTLSDFPGLEQTSSASAALLIRQNTNAFNGNVNGTLLAVNAKNGFTGDLVNFQVNSISKFRIDSAGAIGISGLNSWGDVNFTSTTNSTSSSDGALVVSGGVGIGKTLSVASNIQFAGAMYAGTNTFAKNLGAGDIGLDNGSSDTPSITFYWGNNKNIGLDAYYAGTGATRFRITKELNESGGGELWSVDRNGIVTQTAWDVGETINTRMYNKDDLSMSATTTISNSTYATVATISYTPKSSTSYLWIEFDAHYDFNNGTSADDFFSRITVGGSSIMEKNQIMVGQVGGGTRSGTIFPISARYTNTGTSSLTINIQARQGTADDSIRVYGSTTSGYLRIHEIGR